MIRIIIHTYKQRLFIRTKSGRWCDGWPPLYARSSSRKERMSFTGCPRHARIHTDAERPSLETPCTHTGIHELWIYRTLMHNALRDDGKYGYITRQRPMLFSLASHWLMLIRKSNVADRRARGTKMEERSLRRALWILPSLSLSLSLVIPAAKKGETLEILRNRVTISGEGNYSVIIRGRRKYKGLLLISPDIYYIFFSLLLFPSRN